MERILLATMPAVMATMLAAPAEATGAGLGAVAVGAGVGLGLGLGGLHEYAGYLCDYGGPYYGTPYCGTGTALNSDGTFRSRNP